MKVFKSFVSGLVGSPSRSTKYEESVQEVKSVTTELLVNKSELSPTSLNAQKLTKRWFAYPAIYFENIWHIFERLIGYIGKMRRINFKSFATQALEFAIEKLIEAQLVLNPEPEDKSWSVFVLNTKTHLAVVASPGRLDEVIPDDGSFINGACVYSGLSEEAARVKVTELGQKIGPAEGADSDMS